MKTSVLCFTSALTRPLCDPPQVSCKMVLTMNVTTLQLTVGKLLTHSSYVVFEYCSGTDLFNFLVTGPFEKINR